LEGEVRKVGGQDGSYEHHYQLWRSQTSQYSKVFMPVEDLYPMMRILNILC
jgi:hypothetical protein